MDGFFGQCNMIIRSELAFNKGGMDIKLPFYIHIKDIENNFLFEKETEIECYGKDFYYTSEHSEKWQEFKSYIKYIDYEHFLLETDDDLSLKGLLKKKGNYCIPSDLDSMFIILKDYLKFTEKDFAVIKLFVKEKQLKLIKMFREMVDKELEVGSGKKDPNTIFMILRCAYELNHYATVFEENKNKAISEYSYRELCLQRSYMGRKCEIENLQIEAAKSKSKQK